MTNVSTLDEYRTKHADSTKVGMIAWLSARQSLTPLSHIKADLEAAGLGRLVPRPTAVSDHWRKATSAAARKGVEIGDKRVNVLIRKLKDDEKEIIRSVVIETVDAKGKILAYEESAHVTFNKETEQMRVRRLVDVGGVADDVIQQLRDAFAARIANGGCKDQDDLRSLLTDALKSLNAVTVRETGGVLFVPVGAADTLAQLERVANGWTGVDLHSLPLIEDDPSNPRKQHQMVGAGVTASVLLEVDQILADLREAKAKDGGKLSDRKAGGIVKRSKEIRERVLAYQELLEDGLDEAVDRLGLLEHAMKGAALGAAA